MRRAGGHDGCSARPALANLLSIVLLTVSAVLGLPPGAVAATAAEAPVTYSLVRIPDATAHIESVARLGLAVDDGAHRGVELQVVVNGGELASLIDAGLPYEVMIEDLTSYYAQRAAAERHLWQGIAREDGFGLGSMGGFYTNDEVTDKLDEMRVNYPNLISERQVFSSTFEDRTVWMCRISDNPDVQEDEPVILYTSMTHAREPMGMATVVYYMFYLLENHGIDPEVTYLVDNREMYFVPVLNPDGHAHNELLAPQGGGLWRKNRRDNGNGTFGVDIARNYGYLWGYDNVGSSPNPGSQAYRGPAPFSELETTGVRLFHQFHTVNSAFHYHAYGELEIHPFGYQGDALPPGQDYVTYQRYGQDMQAMSGYLFGNAWQTLQYLTNGDALDWSYGEQEEKNKVFAYAPEVGTEEDAFWPAPTRIVPIAEQNREPNLYMAWIAGGRVWGPQITVGPGVPRGEYSDLVVTLTNIGLADADDVSVEVTSADPYVDDIINPPAFPIVPPQSGGNNQADPSSFRVSATAPLGHVIDLIVTVRHADVVMDQITESVTVIEGTVGITGETHALARRIGITARPNPFNPHTELAVDVDRGGRVQLAIYDVEGRLVRSMIETVHEPGRLRVMFDGRDDTGHELPSGIYVARLTTAGGDATARLVLLR